MCSRKSPSPTDLAIVLYNSLYNCTSRDYQVLVVSDVCIQSLAVHNRDASRADVAGGPPPFIPFAQRGKVENISKRGMSTILIVSMGITGIQ